MKSLSICVHGGRLFDGENFYKKGFILVENGKIEALDESDSLPAADKYIDVKNNIIMPGLVDLHSDTAEKYIEMRPGVFFDQDFALLNLDVRLASTGITSFFHAVSFGEEKTAVRNMLVSEELFLKISELCKKGFFNIRHYLHFRYEVSSEIGIHSLEKFLKDGDLPHLVSFMDHTPGQGQFRDFEEYAAFYSSNYGMSASEALGDAARKKNGSKKAIERIIRAVDILKEKNIVLMSHDDDTSEKIDFLMGMGISASEFPVTEEAAAYASEKGLKVFMGAPNLLRGQSSNGHLDASKTLESGICNGLLSDYYPEALLQAPFAATRRMDIQYEKTLALVTSGPGNFLPEDSSKGRLKKGLPADFIIVSDHSKFIRVMETWVNGEKIYSWN